MRDFTVVLDDCASPPRPDPRQVRLLPTTHGAANFRFSLKQLAAGLPRPLNDRELDWAYVMAGIYAADLACEREIDRDWTRRIELHLPVRSPQLWNGFRIRLEELFGRLTYDQLRLHFHRRQTPLKPPRQSQEQISEAIDCVALLSGGVDSFVGAVELIEQQDRLPVLVSHTGAAAARDAQRALRAPLQALGSVEFAPFGAQRGTGFGAREGSERSRTMLFIGCAGIVASALGVNEVFLNENGVLAIHLPMTEARIGSLSTRTASPRFVEEVSELMSDALQHDILVRNTLVKLTKPDVVELAVANGCAGELIHTVSCWSIGRTRRHCGYCAPCMIRRISTGIHSVADVPYGEDVFADKDVLQRPFARDNVVQLMASLRDIAAASDVEIELEYPELLTGSTSMSASEARELHRRWAAQALGYLESMPVPESLV